MWNVCGSPKDRTGKHCHRPLKGAVFAFCVSSFFSCLRMSVRLISFSMASTCLLRCFRYIPHALQQDSSSSPKRWLTVLLCISDLSDVGQQKIGAWKLSVKIPWSNKLKADAQVLSYIVCKIATTALMLNPVFTTSVPHKSGFSLHSYFFPTLPSLIIYPQ